MGQNKKNHILVASYNIIYNTGKYGHYFFYFFILQWLLLSLHLHMLMGEAVQQN